MAFSFQLIYLPAYQQHLEAPSVRPLLDQLVDLLVRGCKLVLYDFYTNCDIDDEDTPLSHASLVKEKLLAMLATRQAGA